MKKKEIANRDMEIAEDVQNAEVARFVDLKERENSGEQLANKLFAEEQDEFRRAEEEVIRREKRARRDAEKASRLQEEEIANYKAAEDRAKQNDQITKRDEELARRLAMEEEFDLLPSMGDADLAVQLSELEKEKRRKIRRKEEEDRRYAERMLEKDFRKYARIHASREPQRVNHDDMLAIQQIEIDRGNYNVGSDPIPEVRHKDYDRHKRSPQKPKHRQPPIKSAEKSKTKPPSGQRNGSKPPSGQRNLSKDFRQKKAHPLDPTIARQQIPSVAHFPDYNRNPADSDGIESVESFGEFHSPKENFPARRVQSLDSILDTESVCADGRGMDVIIRPGVYQKTPPVQVAERDYIRHKQNNRDVRRQKKFNDEVQRQQGKKGRRPPPQAQPRQPPVHNSPPNRSANKDVHQMLYGQAQRRPPKKQKSSDCSIM